MPTIVKIRDIDRGYARLLSEARKPGGGFVLVGILGSKAAQAKRPSKGATKAEKEAHEAAAKAGRTRSGAPTVAQVAAWQEFGTKGEGGHTPARSFLGAWFDLNLDANRQFARDLFWARVRGRLDYRRSLQLMGARAQAGIQKRIAAGIAPENAKSTKDRKRSSKPLIDTGQLRSSISHSVHLGGKG